jgi:hypothetical protein
MSHDAECETGENGEEAELHIRSGFGIVGWFVVGMRRIV